ncbi:hypothetical protein ABQY74_003290 [Xanthomonas sp. WHRI 7064]|uniref:hypothetical protein n=1 Tax=Xanthomonas sp. WHRI 7064 TaxID=3161568 RepID=UPI0035576B1A
MVQLPGQSRPARAFRADATPLLACTCERPARAIQRLPRPLDETLSDELLASIRRHLQQQRAQGDDAFRAMVEAKIRRFAGVRPAHRPRKQSAID